MCWDAGKAQSQLVCPASASQKQLSSSNTRLDLSPGVSGVGSPIERASTLSTSTELGSYAWKISKYERNPPEEADEGDHILLKGVPTCTSPC